MNVGPSIAVYGNKKGKKKYRGGGGGGGGEGVEVRILHPFRQKARQKNSEIWREKKEKSFEILT